jgi:hypothetical protein
MLLNFPSFPRILDTQSTRAIGSFADRACG